MKEMFIEKTPETVTEFNVSSWDELQMNHFRLSGDAMSDRKILETSTSSGAFHLHFSPEHEQKPFLESHRPESNHNYLNADTLRTAISLNKGFMENLESTSLKVSRHELARKLAEVLLQGRAEDRSGISVPKLRSLFESESNQQKESNIFIPCNNYEEITLLLLISEATAVHEVVLSQSPEFKDARLQAFFNVVSIYDMLTILLVRWGCVDVLHEYFERAMKFSFEEPHIWKQEALSLLSLGQHSQALKVMKEVARLLPTDAFHCLLAARNCYEHLFEPFEGLKWSQEALSRASDSSESLISRSHLFVGIGYSMKASVNPSNKMKQNLIAKAFDEFNEAQRLDPNDHLPEYYLALQYALESQIGLATTHTKTALNLRAEHQSSLHLLILLLSAQKHYEDALQLVDATLDEYPDCVNLLYIKAQLELQTDDRARALLTGKLLLNLWKELYKEHIDRETSEKYERQSDNQSSFKKQHSLMSDDTAQAVGVSQIEQTLSDVATSLSSFVPRSGPQNIWLLQLKIWLLLAETYISLDSLNDAAACIQEAQNLFPMSHSVMYFRGLLHEHKKEYSKAVHFFQNAIAINPLHIKSLQHLGLAHHYLGNQNMAEKALRDALKIDQSSYETWHYMSLVLESVEEFESASDCIIAALEKESTCPILPFSTIPLPFD